MRNKHIFQAYHTRKRLRFYLTIMNRKNASLNIFILTFADETVNHT